MNRTSRGVTAHDPKLQEKEKRFMRHVPRLSVTGPQADYTANGLLKLFPNG